MGNTELRFSGRWLESVSRRYRLASILVAFLCLAGLSPFFSSPSLAQTATKPTPAVTKPETTEAKPAVEAKKPVTYTKIEGFRSAKFGMNEKEIRKAIFNDFEIRKNVRKDKSRIERTRSLNIRSNDVLPEGGRTSVSYVMGFKSKALIQVGISWSRATDKKIDDAMLYANGQLLQKHFLEQGYDPATVKSGVVLNNGLLLFQASDADGHTVILLLQGRFKTNKKDKSRVLDPDALVLLYVKSLEKPDVYKIQKGKF